MRFTEIISESVSTRLKDIAKIATNMPDADFWLVRKGSDKTVGKPVKEFDPSRIGIKVVKTDVLDPNYLYYAMMNLHHQGQFARIANGTTNLVNITVADIANMPLGQQGMTEGEVIPMQPRNPLNKNLIIQLKALSETALEIFWEGSYMPTAAQGQMAQLSQQEQTKIFNQNVAQFKALGYETAIFEDDMDILFLHSIAREAWYDSKKPMSKYRGLPDLEYNSDTNSLKIIDLIGDDDKGIVYDKNVYEQDVAGGLNEFSLSNNDGNGDEKSYLLHLASDLSNALYVLKNKQAVKDVKDKIIASGGDVKITWNDDGSFNVVMYHPTYFKQGYLISLVGKGKQQDVDEDWQKVNKKDKTDGMSKKAVSAYRRENPGSKLKTAVTTKPSKLKKGSKDASRRKSFCARMGGMKKAHASAKTKRDPDSPINKALRRWNCESVEQMQELVMIAEQMVRKAKL